MSQSRIPASDAGKRRRMSRLADDEGRFAMIAVDQGTSLQGMLDDDLDDEELQRAMEAVKRDLAKTVALLSTALLTDPVYGYPHTVDAVPARVGLILAVEVSGCETAHEYERKSRLLTDFDVEAAAAAGADGAKLLIWHYPDAFSEIQQHQHDIVRRVGAACKDAGMPFILEIVTYGLGYSTSSSDYVRRKPKLILDGVRTYSAGEFWVDLFKVQMPANLKYTEGFQNEPYAQCPVFFSREEVDAYCRELDEAVSAPWVILNAGVEPDEFIENVSVANSSGASGFLCGRAVWKNVVRYIGDEHEMERFMTECGCVHFRRIRGANYMAHPWFSRSRLADWVVAPPLFVHDPLHSTNPTH